MADALVKMFWVPERMNSWPNPARLTSSFRGKSAHCANAEQGIDALAIGCELVGELYQMEKSELPADAFRLVKFGRMESGAVRNVISAKNGIGGICSLFL